MKKKKKEFLGAWEEKGKGGEKKKRENQAAHPGTKSGSFLMDSTAIS